MELYSLERQSPAWQLPLQVELKKRKMPFEKNFQHLIGIIVRDDWIFASISRELSEYFLQRESFLKVMESIQFLVGAL